MRVLILEDEPDIAEVLERYLLKINPEIEVIGVIHSIASAKEWFIQHPEPDLLLIDVRLADGNSFEIFEEVEVECPVIFTTGHEEYALKAFELNSIDYLLKPVKLKDLKKSIEKYEKVNRPAGGKARLEGLLSDMGHGGESFRTRFLVKKGQSFTTVIIDEVAYFCVENQLTFLYTHGGKRHLLDLTLDQLIKQLDPNRFYRVNRQFIVSAESIQTIHNYFNNRLTIKLMPKPIDTEQVVVSARKVVSFKEWLDR